MGDQVRQDGRSTAVPAVPQGATGGTPVLPAPSPLSPVAANLGGTPIPRPRDWGPLLRPFGWAGLLMYVPRSFRLARVEGNDRSGKLVLADEDRPRLEIAWGRVERRRFDPQRFLTRQLRRALGRDRAEVVAAGARPVEHPAFSPMIRLFDPEAHCDRYVGYEPRTRRVVEMIYHHGKGQQDELARRVVVPRMTDQPADRTQYWAFFGASFTSPSGFAVVGATLNLGDMAVRMIKPLRWGRRAELVIRHIYPAGLALARQPLQQWLTQILRQKDSAYHPRHTGWLWWKKLRFTPIQTSRGPGLVADAFTRLIVQALLWRASRRRRTWIIHDQEHDRLLVVQLADPTGGDESALQSILDGLQWAEGPPVP